MPVSDPSAPVISDNAGLDVVQGVSGNDVTLGFRGDDRMLGSRGSDVTEGGLGADTFVWSAGHIDDGAVDYVTDFSLAQGDMLEFLDSASGAFNVLSITVEGVEETEFNGHNLRNNTWRDNDIVFTVEHAETGDTQEIVLLDAWSAATDGDWIALLADMGLEFGEAEMEPEICEIVPIDSDTFVIDDCLIAL